MKTIGIIGTRSRNTEKDFQLTREAFLKVYKKGDRICSGLCPKGGDRFAVLLQEEFNTPKLWFPAEWKKYGKSAGYIRNIDIAKNSDILIAVINSNRNGGTEDTIKKFIKYHAKTNDKLILI